MSTISENERYATYMLSVLLRSVGGGHPPYHKGEVDLSHEWYAKDWRDIQEWIETP